MNQSELIAELYSKGIADGADGKPKRSIQPDYLRGYNAGVSLFLDKQRVSLDKLIETVIQPKE